MSQAIWKTTLDVESEQEILVPADAEMLLAREQFAQIAVWYRCTPSQPMMKRTILVCGTGHPAPAPMEARYLGSAFLGGGQLVFHVFERIPGGKF